MRDTAPARSLAAMTRLAWSLSFVCAVALVVAPLSSQVRPGFKPVSFGIVHDYEVGHELREVEADFRLLQTLEVDSWRGRFAWDELEPEPGRYTFEWLHEFAELARRYHLTLRPSIAHSPEWAARSDAAADEARNSLPARLEDWRRFTAALGTALARHRHVTAFEIAGAPERWSGTPGDYANVLIAGARELRAASLATVILPGGLTPGDTGWLAQVCQAPQARAAFDVLPIHVFPEASLSSDDTVERSVEGLDAFIAAADAACGRKAIWINETGFATVDGRTELEQAIWWVRAIATFLAHPRIEHIGISAIRDARPGDRVDGDATGARRGLTRSDGTRKLAFGTVDMLTDLLDTGMLSVDTGQLQVRVLQGPAEAGLTQGPAKAGLTQSPAKAGLYYELFTRTDGDKVLIVWSMDASMTLAIEVPDIRSFVEYSLAGQPSGWDQDASGLSEFALTAGMPRILKLLR
jgi:polysaccharide biosynthesis protein PslG